MCSLLTSAMNWRGYKLHCLCVLVALWFVEQLSWHYLPIWLLSLAAPVWSTRSFLPLAVLQILTWTLPSFLGIKNSLYFPHPPPTQHANVSGMNPMLMQPTPCYWISLKMNKPGLAYWQYHVQSLVHGSMPCPLLPWACVSVMTWLYGCCWSPSGCPHL